VPNNTFGDISESFNNSSSNSNLQVNSPGATINARGNTPTAQAVSDASF
jgi:hypothetical protein